MTSRYGVIIVGAGPAGIFAALELCRLGRTDVLVVEKGRPLSKRTCPARQTACMSCKTCDIMTGWGGAGAFSDGKLTLTAEVGGWLSEYVNEEELRSLIEYSDERWLEFGATPELHEPDGATANRLKAEAAAAEMSLVPMRIRHLGSDRSPELLESMRRHLAEHDVEIRTQTAARQILADSGRVVGVELDDGSIINAHSVIAAPGREGSEWLAQQAGSLGIELENNAVDIGVRLECPAQAMKHLTDSLYEAKLLYRTKAFGDTVRTFCMNPYGEVTTESYGDVITVNGHSYADDGRRTTNTNFAVLVSQRFTEPFRDPIAYGRSVARLANLLGAGILVQRYCDLRQGRRSTSERIAESVTRPTMSHATPGDLACVLPYRHLTDIVEFIEALDRLAPGVAGEDTLLYGVEVKFYSSRLQVGPDMQTSVEGLFAVGDGAGITRGLVQASISGVIAARAAAAT